MLRKLWLLLLLVSISFSLASAQETRHFTFHYGFTVKNVPPGEKLRVWIPAAHSDQFQEVKVVSANGDLPLKQTHESRFGNEMYYAETSKAKQAELHFEVVYDVVRHERLTLALPGRIWPKFNSRIATARSICSRTSWCRSPDFLLTLQ